MNGKSAYSWFFLAVEQGRLLQSNFGSPSASAVVEPASAIKSAFAVPLWSRLKELG